MCILLNLYNVSSTLSFHLETFNLKLCFMVFLTMKLRQILYLSGLWWLSCWDVPLIRCYHCKGSQAHLHHNTQNTRGVTKANTITPTAATTILQQYKQVTGASTFKVLACSILYVFPDKCWRRSYTTIHTAFYVYQLYIFMSLLVWVK